MVRGGGDNRVPAGSSALAAIVHGACPRCRVGRIFAGLVTMNPACPACGLEFRREPGYFTGAMYVSYALAVPLVAALVVLVYLVAPAWRLEWLVLAASVGFLPLMPFVFRWSRILWIHLDRTIDP